VDALDRRAGRRPAVAGVGKRVEQDTDPLRRLGMAEGRVQARERRMRQDVDRGTGRSRRRTSKRMANTGGARSRSRRRCVGNRVLSRGRSRKISSPIVGSFASV
jgi:hypothetical protein